MVGLPPVNTNQIPNIHLAKKLFCKKCKSDVFDIAFHLKSLSALASPTGKIMNIHFQVWVCKLCGTPAELPQ